MERDEFTCAYCGVDLKDGEHAERHAWRCEQHPLFKLNDLVNKLLDGMWQGANEWVISDEVFSLNPLLDFLHEQGRLGTPTKFGYEAYPVNLEMIDYRKPTTRELPSGIAEALDHFLDPEAGAEGHEDRDGCRQRLFDMIMRLDNKQEQQQTPIADAVAAGPPAPPPDSDPYTRIYPEALPDPEPRSFGPCPKCFWPEVRIYWQTANEAWDVICIRCNYRWTERPE